MPFRIVPDWTSDPDRSRRVVYTPPAHKTARRRSVRRHDAKSAMAQGRGLVVGLDLAQAGDFTALAVVERVADGYVVPELARTRGRAYPDLVAELAVALAEPALAGADLVVDATGVGRPVVNMLRDAGLDPLAVTLTGGERVTPAGRRALNVPTREIIETVLVLMQAGAVQVAADLPLAPVLARELTDVRLQLTASGRSAYRAQGDDRHDDLVMALGLALWWSERRPGQPSIRRPMQPASDASAPTSPGLRRLPSAEEIEAHLDDVSTRAANLIARSR